MAKDHERRNDITSLPAPDLKGTVSLEEALQKRESWRHFSTEALTKEEISRILWAAQGVTRRWGGRTAPSAGALYPLETYVVLEDGVFHYLPGGHQLLRLTGTDVRGALSVAALSQGFIGEAPAIIVVAVVLERIARKYGSRGERYALIEVGHMAQNILLQAAALGLGAVPVGAFHDEPVRKVLSLPEDHKPFYLIPVGHKRK